MSLEDLMKYASQDAKKTFASDLRMRDPKWIYSDDCYKFSREFSKQHLEQYVWEFWRVMREEQKCFFWETLNLYQFKNEFDELCRKHNVKLYLDMDCFIKEEYYFQPCEAPVAQL